MRDFFKQTFASLIGSLVGLFIFFGLGTFGLIFLLIAATSKDEGPRVKQSSVLVFDLSLNIADSNPSSSTAEAISEAFSGDTSETIALRQVLDAIDRASKDNRIAAIFLDGTGNQAGRGNGLATLKEVRSALERFKASGKKVIAYDVALEKREYYLSSVADTIIINPMGGMEINGLRSEPMFLTGALQKYGIGVQVIRVGKYKAAVEPFILDKLSPENKQQTQALLNDLWSEFKTTTAKSRKLNPQQIQTLADQQAVLSATEAKTNRLVDKVAYSDEVTTELQQLSRSTDEDGSFPKISLTEYASLEQQDTTDSSSRSARPQIAVVYAEGEIVDGEGSTREVGGDRFAKKLRQLRLDPNVKAIVLRVNSPGGSALASDVIQREVRLTQEKKPVIVSMGDVAASGGYWIATYSDRIFAESGTITGSIGVFGLLLNVQKIANNNGITWDVVKTSRFADSTTVTRPKTPQELEIYQKLVNQTYDQFLTKVAQSRKLSKQKVEEIAQGRVWSGQQALKLGLVDEIGGLNQAILYAAKKADLGSDWQLKEYPPVRSLEEQILQQLLGGETAAKQKTPDILTAEFLKLQQDLGALKTMNDPMGIYVRLPFNLRID
ncbi:MAG: signal peptide peptidase SppA [Cyanosarcina radialis HA8281-LM2]|jgi:protease-4|nr:signal peptide peptidase SppA [Cyanosarcina radialis HA8281-LM2]